MQNTRKKDALTLAQEALGLLCRSEHNSIAKMSGFAFWRTEKHFPLLLTLSLSASTCRSNGRGLRMFEATFGFANDLAPSLKLEF
jgi:hypothetical protein